MPPRIEAWLVFCQCAGDQRGVGRVVFPSEVAEAVEEEFAGDGGGGGGVVVVVVRGWVGAAGKVSASGLGHVV